MRHFFSFFLLIVLLITIIGCGQSKAEKEAASPVTLKAWAVFEDQDAITNLMDAYRKVHSNVSFDLRLLRYDEYEDELWQAFAVGEGPDIFSIHNTWIGEYKELISPLPSSLTIPYTETKGNLKKETITVLRTEKTLTKQELKNNFIDVVYDDVLLSYQPNPDKEASDTIFALPFSVDTLVLYSNTDLLNNANIAEPPITWQEFQEQVKVITHVNEKGEIISSAAALGAGKNVERASDILSLLMLQSGVTMEQNKKTAMFSENTNRSTASLEALNFYTAFANPVKEVYTWNENMPDSFEAFVNGKTAFFFGYAYHLPLIKARAPKLNYRISALPQISNDPTTSKIVNFANYWVWTVAKSSKNTKWGWDFIQLAAKKDNVKNYLTTSTKPTALRGLINDQLTNADLEIFANQLLTAESWYHGKDAGVVESTLVNLIDNTLAGTNEPRVLLREAQNKINQTY